MCVRAYRWSVCACVCLSVCWLQASVVSKRLNRLRCRLGVVWTGGVETKEPWFSREPGFPRKRHSCRTHFNTPSRQPGHARGRYTQRYLQGAAYDDAELVNISPWLSCRTHGGIRTRVPSHHRTTVGHAATRLVWRPVDTGMIVLGWMPTINHEQISRTDDQPHGRAQSRYTHAIHTVTPTLSRRRGPHDMGCTAQHELPILNSKNIYVGLLTQ